MRKLLFLLIVPVKTCLAQSLHYLPAVIYPGAGAYSNNFTDIFSFRSNEAALANVKQFSAGVYSEKKFLLQELNYYTLAVAVPIQNGGVGITAGYTGFTDYNETQLGISYGKSLGRVDLGVHFSYNMIKIAAYGNDNAVSFSVGTIWHVSEQLHTGFEIFNPVGGKFSKNKDEKLAAVYRIGFGYEASKLVFIEMQIIKEENKAVSINGTIQYAFAKKFFLRGGIETGTGSPYLGAGLGWKNFRIDIVSSYHPQLGITPGLMLIFSQKDKEK